MHLTPALKNKFYVSPGSNRTYYLAQEISKEYGIDVKVLLGLIRRKTYEQVAWTFYETLKAEAESRPKLFMWKLSQIPNKHFLRQPRLKLK